METAMLMSSYSVDANGKLICTREVEVRVSCDPSPALRAISREAQALETFGRWKRALAVEVLDVIVESLPLLIEPRPRESPRAARIERRTHRRAARADVRRMRSAG